MDGPCTIAAMFIITSAQQSINNKLLLVWQQDLCYGSAWEAKLERKCLRSPRPKWYIYISTFEWELSHINIQGASNDQEWWRCCISPPENEWLLYYEPKWLLAQYFCSAGSFQQKVSKETNFCFTRYSSFLVTWMKCVFPSCIVWLLLCWKVFRLNWPFTIRY